MPSLFTHNNIGEDVLKNVDREIRHSIKKEIDYYSMFNQGWDNIFYCAYKWKYYKRFAVKAQRRKTDEFFKNIIQYIKTYNLQENPQITNFLYGFINHFVTDTIIHPYINYQVKNTGLPHSKVEFMLDTKVSKKVHPKYFREVIPKVKFNEEMIQFIDIIFDSTYGEKNIGKRFNNSHNRSYYLYRYFIYDRWGIKSKIYSIIDFIFPFKELNLHEFTYYYKEFDNRLLNEDKLVWNHPSDEMQKYKYSFKELYDYTVEISTNLINKAYKVLNNKYDLEDFIDLILKVNINNIQELLN